MENSEQTSRHDLIKQKLDEFLHHRPYFEFFRDTAVAVAKESMPPAIKTRVENTTYEDVISLQPFLYVSDGNNWHSTTAEFIVLMRLYSKAKKILENPKATKKEKEDADHLLATSDIDTLHQYIKDFIKLYNAAQEKPQDIRTDKKS